MADINVERKGPSIWPWIIGLIVLALLIWALAELLGDGDDDIAEPVATEEVAPAPPLAEEPLADEEEAAGGALAAGLPAEVTEYGQTCTVPPEGEVDAGVQHEYTVNCINSLSAALDAVIEQNQIAGTDVEQGLASLQESAQQLEESPAEAETHANLVREAFVSAADLMESVSQAGFAGAAEVEGELTEVRQAAESVQADVGLLEQQGAVETFFDESGDVLEEFAETPAPTI